MSERSPKHKIYDSVFTHMLKIKRFLREFYLDIHPESSHITEEMLDYVTIDDALAGGIRNDLGFTAEGRLMVLAEAQTRWSSNMPVRMMLYYSETLQRWIADHDIDMHATSKIRLPSPELYVVYTGPGRRPSELSFAAEHCAGVSDVDLRVRVLQDSGKGSLIDQYIRFTRAYSAAAKRHGRSIETLRAVIEECKDKDILREYLSSRESEVSDLMIYVLSQEYEDKMSAKRVERALGEGIERGIKKGRAEGREEGRAEGSEITLTNLVKDGYLSPDVAQKYILKSQRSLSVQD